MLSVMGYLTLHFEHRREPVITSPFPSASTLSSSLPLHTGQARISKSERFMV